MGLEWRVWTFKTYCTSVNLRYGCPWASWGIYKIFVGVARDCLWELITDILEQNKYSINCQINGQIVMKQTPKFWVVTFFICWHEPRLFFTTVLYFDLYEIHSHFIEVAKQPSLECLHIFSRDLCKYIGCPWGFCIWICD